MIIHIWWCSAFLVLHFHFALSDALPHSPEEMQKRTGRRRRLSAVAATRPNMRPSHSPTAGDESAMRKTKPPDISERTIE
ncbi:unnamed protein product, partial [Iphiclides podalirius]